MNSDAFNARLTTVAAETEALLDRLLGAAPARGEIAPPERLLAAMRRAVLDGGKRLRPFLLVETTALFGGAHDGALLAGAALECMHCYSLVHDDLPAMDDDDLRRGRPSVHKAFDEATAILAGDALLTFAFELMARGGVHPDASVRITLVSALAGAAGMAGMAGGQMIDLAAEGRFEKKRELGENEIATLQAMKTGALIRFAWRAGAILGHADATSRAAIDRYGAAVGQAFQIADDLLDVEGDSGHPRQGAACGKDAAAGGRPRWWQHWPRRRSARARLVTQLVAEADAALASVRCESRYSARCRALHRRANDVEGTPDGT